MEIELCPNFYYRISSDNVLSLFNTDKDNISRNNCKINFYNGEWVKIKINDYILHIVKPMESLQSLSEKYDIPIENIREFNQLQTDKLFIGQRIKIKKISK